MEDWAKRDFNKIIKLCYSADAFQDAPFCFPYTYQVLHTKFPNAKFILSVRDSPQQWYSSITRFHSKIWGKNNNLPTSKDLRDANYIFKGRPI